jgi:5-methyltetrahydropteroyltriglutamate--homocysteine methyltransferase
MAIPTELIGSIPRPGYLLAGMPDLAAGKLDDAGLDALSTRALTETSRGGRRAVRRW